LIGFYTDRQNASFDYTKALTYNRNYVFDTVLQYWLDKSNARMYWGGDGVVLWQTNVTMLCLWVFIF